jgi:DNA-binding YbaB/EbfC family protein
MKNLGKIMKQAMKMQEKMQEEMENLSVSASTGGEMVTVSMNGKKEVLSVKIQPEAVDPEDVEMLQDLILSAFNEAARKVDEELQEKMGGLTGGLNIPGLGL